MLPDYPKAKKIMYEKLMERVEKRSKHQTGLLKKLSIKPVMEGHRFRIERPDGSIDDQEYQRFEANVEIGKNEIKRISMDAIIKKFDDAADELARSQSSHLFNELDRITNEVGNIIEGKGEPFSMEKFFQVLEKTQIDFGPNGNPTFSIVAGPELSARIKKVLSEALKNPEYRNRHREIMERKRREWRDRESLRKLVG